jgi:hypothetical protein
MFGAKELIQSSTIFLIVMSVVLILTMGILYGFVGHVIYKQTKHFKDMRDQSSRLKLLFSNLYENGQPNLQVIESDADQNHGNSNHSVENEVDQNHANNNQLTHPPLKVRISENNSSNSSKEVSKSSTLKSNTSTLSHRKRSLASSISSSAKAHKSSIMFIVITIITIISFIPTWIFVLFDSKDPSRWFYVSNTEHQLFLFLRCLHGVGYTANPVIYAYYDRSFRREIKAMARCNNTPRRRGSSTT